MSGARAGKKLLRTMASQRGDTIVEVMISLIVISTVIVGAFIVSRTSSRNIRSSEEHSQALQLLQGQVELLRAYSNEVAADPSLPALPTSDFCMDSTNGATAGTPITSCSVNVSSAYTYTLNIETDSIHADTYKFTVNWPSQDGTTSQESFVYRPAQLGS